MFDAILEHLTFLSLHALSCYCMFLEHEVLELLAFFMILTVIVLSCCPTAIVGFAIVDFKNIPESLIWVCPEWTEKYSSPKINYTWHFYPSFWLGPYSGTRTYSLNINIIRVFTAIHPELSGKWQRFCILSQESIKGLLFSGVSTSLN